jgi:hypothetical protein
MKRYMPYHSVLKMLCIYYRTVPAHSQNANNATLLMTAAALVWKHFARLLQ